MMTSSGGKLVLTIRVLQLVDAALVFLGFWLAAEARSPVREIFGMTALGGRSMLSETSWVLYIAVPFTPLLLEYFGFYENVHGKSRGRALLQVGKTLAVIGLVLGLISTFSRLQDASRLILLLAVPIVAVLLMMRERWSNWRESISGVEPQD